MIEGRLSESVIRAGWEAMREDMRADLLSGKIPGTGKRFNPNSVEKFIDNFINSAVFAQLPCTNEKAVIAMFTRYSGRGG